VAQGGAAERGAGWRRVARLNAAQGGAGWRRVARLVSKSPANEPRQTKRNKISKISIANAIIFRKDILVSNFLAHSS
jgi:hypothetical protein